MTDATIESFRAIADAMAGPAPRDWEWIGAHLSQRMFGINEKRARNYAAIYGGIARQMRTCACGLPAEHTRGCLS